MSPRVQGNYLAYICSPVTSLLAVDIIIHNKEPSLGDPPPEHTPQSDWQINPSDGSIASHLLHYDNEHILKRSLKQLEMRRFLS